MEPLNLNHLPEDVFNHKCCFQELELLKELDYLIETHFKKNRNCEFYASKLNRSTNALNKIIIFYRGATVHKIIDNRLYTESVNLLSCTRLSAKEISYELGFCDPGYFARWFKKHTSISPSTFRIMTITQSKQHEVHFI